MTVKQNISSQWTGKEISSILQIRSLSSMGFVSLFQATKPAGEGTLVAGSRAQAPSVLSSQDNVCQLPCTYSPALGISVSQRDPQDQSMDCREKNPLSLEGGWLLCTSSEAASGPQCVVGRRPKLCHPGSLLSSLQPITITTSRPCVHGPRPSSIRWPATSRTTTLRKQAPP